MNVNNVEQFLRRNITHYLYLKKSKLSNAGHDIAALHDYKMKKQ